MYENYSSIRTFSFHKKRLIKTIAILKEDWESLKDRSFRHRQDYSAYLQRLAGQRGV